MTEEAPRVKRKYVRRKPLPPRKNSRGAAAALSPVVQHLPPSPAGGSQPALPQHVTHQSPVQHAAQQSSRLQMPQQPMSPPQLYIPNIIPQVCPALFLCSLHSLRRHLSAALLETVVMAC